MHAGLQAYQETSINFFACVLSSFLSMYSPLSLRSLQSPTLFETKLKDPTTRHFWAFLVWKQTFSSWWTRIGLWLVDLAKCKSDICSALLLKRGRGVCVWRRCRGFWETRIIWSPCNQWSRGYTFVYFLKLLNPASSINVLLRSIPIWKHARFPNPNQMLWNIASTISWLPTMLSWPADIMRTYNPPCLVRMDGVLEEVYKEIKRHFSRWTGKQHC